jgi:hypothetical protein
MRIPLRETEIPTICDRCKHHQRSVLLGSVINICSATAGERIDTVTGERSWSRVASCWFRNMFGRCKHFVYGG